VAWQAGHPPTGNRKSASELHFSLTLERVRKTADQDGMRRVLLLAAVPLIAGACGIRGSNAAATTTTTISLQQRTTKAEEILRLELCGGPKVAGCTVEASPGAIEVHIGKYAIDTSKLRSAGQWSGFWNNADVARMEHTRALDGTQHTPDNKVSWTYHPDSGLNMVVTVDGSWEPPKTVNRV
jgi:hypothetical protein